MKLVDCQAFGPSEIRHQPRVEIAGSGTHRETGGRRETHARINTAAVPHGGHAGPIAQMGENHPAASSLTTGQPFQLFHKIGVGQAVEPIPPDPLLLIAARDRQHARDRRQMLMKPRVEAGHLLRIGIAVGKGLNQREFRRKMLRIVRAEPPQFLNHLRRDHVRVDIPMAPVHHPMTDSLDSRALSGLRQSLDQPSCGIRMAPHLRNTTLLPPGARIGHSHHTIRKPDPLDVSRCRSDRRVVHSKHRPFHTRRPGVDGQDGRRIANGFWHERPFLDSHHRSTTGSAQPENPSSRYLGLLRRVTLGEMLVPYGAYMRYGMRCFLCYSA